MSTATIDNARLAQLETSSTSAFRFPGSEKKSDPASEPKEPTPKEEPGQQPPKQKPHEMSKQEVQDIMKREGIMPLADTSLVVLTTNYSIAPGMVWFELTTPATFTATGTVKVAINPRGSGQLLAQGLSIPVAVAVIAPTPLPGSTFRQVNQVMPPASCTPLSGTPLEDVIARLWAPGPLISGCETQIGPAITGMSVQGFPGYPRQLMPSGPTAVLPSGLGINRAYVDTTVNPFELAIVFQGSGSVPAGTRWLVITITGV